MRLKRIISATLVLIIILTFEAFAYVDSELLAQQLNKAMLTTGSYITETVKEPTISSVGGEWAVIGLSRSSLSFPDDYYDKYYNNVVSLLKENEGELTKVKYTEYSRLILALTAIGKDVTNVGGYNILEKLAEFKNVKKQGLNGPIYALIALDCYNYEIPQTGTEDQTTRQKLLDYILDSEVTDSNGVVGGFSLGGSSPDPDITGMALQALANYKDQQEVSEVISRALIVLENMDIEKAGSEGIVQIILGKIALGIDCFEEINNLLKYYIEDLGFKHYIDGKINLMASEQCLYAIAAYERFINGENALYDMTDIEISSGEKNPNPMKYIFKILESITIMPINLVEWDQVYKTVIINGRY